MASPASFSSLLKLKQTKCIMRIAWVKCLDLVLDFPHQSTLKAKRQNYKYFLKSFQFFLSSTPPLDRYNFLFIYHNVKHFPVVITRITLDLLPFNSWFSTQVNIFTFFCHIIIMFTNNLMTVYSMYALAATKLPSKPDFKYNSLKCHFSNTRQLWNLPGMFLLSQDICTVTELCKSKQYTVNCKTNTHF